MFHKQWRRPPLRQQGWSAAKTGLMWGAVVLVCALTAVFGFWLGNTVSAATGAGAAAIAAGGVLAMLTDSLIPFSFAKGGRPAGIWTVVGFAVTLLLI